MRFFWFYTLMLPNASVKTKRKEYEDFRTFAPFLRFHPACNGIQNFNHGSLIQQNLSRGTEATYACF